MVRETSWRDRCVERGARARREGALGVGGLSFSAGGKRTVGLVGGGCVDGGGLEMWWWMMVEACLPRSRVPSRHLGIRC